MEPSGRSGHQLLSSFNIIKGFRSAGGNPISLLVKVYVFLARGRAGLCVSTAGNPRKPPETPGNLCVKTQETPGHCSKFNHKSERIEEKTKRKKRYQTKREKKNHQRTGKLKREKKRREKTKETGEKGYKRQENRWVGRSGRGCSV